MYIYMHIRLVLFQTDPSKWSVDEVCQWLELIGLGAFRQAFRGRCCIL